MSTTTEYVTMVEVECFNEDLEQWEHFHDAGLNEILREINPNFQGRVITPETQEGGHKPRIVRLSEQCKQLGYSGLNEAFAEWQSTQDDLVDPVTACHICKAYHDAGHQAGGTSPGAGCSCAASQLQAERAQPTATSSSASSSRRSARLARPQPGSHDTPMAALRSRRKPRRSADRGWSEEEDTILRQGIQQGWTAKKIISELPHGTRRTESGVRGRKRVLLSRGPTRSRKTSTRSRPAVTVDSTVPESDIVRNVDRSQRKGTVTQAWQIVIQRPAQCHVEAATDLEDDILTLTPNQSDRSSNTGLKGRKWTKEEDDILFEALRKGWNATMTLTQLPNNNSRSPSGIRSRKIVLKRKHPALTSHSTPRPINFNGQVPGRGGQSQVVPSTPTRNTGPVDLVDLCGSDEETDEDSAQSPLAARVRPSCDSSGARQRQEQHLDVEVAGASLEAKVVAGRPIAYVVLNRPKKISHRIEKPVPSGDMQQKQRLKAFSGSVQLGKRRTSNEAINVSLNPTTSETAEIPTPRSSGKQRVYSEHELRLLNRLVEEDHMPWDQILTHFPGRSLFSLTGAYYTQVRGE